MRPTLSATRKCGAAGFSLAIGLLPSVASAQASPSPFTTGVRYDAVGRITATIAPDSGAVGGPSYLAVRNSYDGAGRLVKVEHGALSAWQSENVKPKDWTNFTVSRTLVIKYSSTGRKLQEITSAGGVVAVVTDYSYDAAGRLECTAVRMNPAIFPSAEGLGGSLPASACTMGTEGTAGSAFGPDRITRNVYDNASQRLQVIKAFGTSIQEAEATWAYNLNGQVTDTIDANGNRATYTYDGHQRLWRWTFPSTVRPTAFNDATQLTALASAGAANASDYEEYSYDNNGNRLTLRKRDSKVIGFDYDEANRVKKKTVPVSLSGAAAYSIYYGYDNRGLQTYVRFGSSTSTSPGVTNEYDGFGRLWTSSTNMDGVTRKLTYGYDGDGNKVQITGTGTNYAVYYDYDGLDRVTNVKPSSASWVAANIDYDTQGRRWHVKQGPNGAVSSTTTYSYDGVSRPTSIVHDFANTSNDVTYSYSKYNPASQVFTRVLSNDLYASNTAYAVSRGYGVNGLNQYSTVGATSYVYDQNGNLTSDGSTTFIYDSENRLVSASGVKNATLYYDPLGRLWKIVTPGGAAVNTTTMTYDGDNRIEEYDGAGVRLRNYIHGIGKDEPLVAYELPPSNTYQPRYLHSDHQGSIIAVAGDDGNPVARNAYDAWGIPNLANVGKFQYTGQAWISELGLYYYKARMYSPTLGRFMQTDPIGYDDQVNLYAYVGNDPVRGRDPDGKCRNRDSDGECVVENQAGKEGEAAAARLQSVVRDVDHQIRSLGDKEKVTLEGRDGKPVETNGKALKREWARTTWTVIPESSTAIRNKTASAEMSDSGHFKTKPGYFMNYFDNAVARGKNGLEAQTTVVLHDFSHTLDADQAIRAFYGALTDDAERATSRNGQVIGNTIGRRFECSTFAIGC